MHTEALNLREVVVFLITAGFVVPILHRLKISPVLGFLVAGLVIGPYGIARFAGDLPWLSYLVISDTDGVGALAELGVMFLLFMVGLDLSLDRLWSLRTSVFGLGGAQVVVTGAVIAAIATLFDNTLTAAIVLGAAFALSSTAIVLQVLIENRRLGTATGQTTFAVLLFQDLAVLPILLLLGIFGAGGRGPVSLALAYAFAEAALAIALILLLGRLVIRPLFRFVGSHSRNEMFLAAVLLVIIGTAFATQQAGLSLALGAFLVGLLFSETEYRHEIEVDIEPFKGLLMGLFFVSVGMGIDLSQLSARPVWLASSVFGLFAVKGVIFYGLARSFHRSHAVALESAMLLGQGGEFGFIVIGMGLASGIIPGDTAQFMLIVIGLSMLATPVVATSARRVARSMERRALARPRSHAEPAPDLVGHVIIVGYGRVGQMLGEILGAEGLPYVAIDVDTELVAGFADVGACVYFGDARQSGIFRRMGAERAGALVVTMDSVTAAENVVKTARQSWPSLPIFARARDRAHAARLLALGAIHVIPETIEASLELSELVLMGAGVPDNAARQVIEVRRQAEHAALHESRGDT